VHGGEKNMDWRAPLGWTERVVEASIFWARWMLAPAYLVLAGCLATLLFTTFVEFVELFKHDVHLFAETKAIVQVLTIVDLVLVMNLVLLMMFVGYVNFVSRIHPRKQEDWPMWMGQLDYSGLKTQLMGSIIAVSSILILREVIELFSGGKIDADRFVWMIAFHLTFVISIVVIGLVNKMKPTVTHSQF
jgi:uncharacterized protein (TIGR00645 family)